MRTYVVLAQESDGLYRFVSNYEAGSADQAIRLAATDYGDAKYVAVPDRSWNENQATRKVIIVLGNEDVAAAVAPDEPDEEPEDDEPEDDDDAPPTATQTKLAE